MTTRSRFRLFVLGPPRVEKDGETLDVSPRKALALLVYLAVTGQPHTRDVLATLFWPDSDRATGRASLRRTLYRIHQALGEEVLSLSADTVALDPAAGLEMDVHAYRHALATGLEQGDVAPLADAVRLYTDDFLAGFHLSDSPEYDDWQFFQRESLQQSLATALAQLADIYQAQGDNETAIGYARRLLTLDPLHEPVHRRLMLLYAWAGQHAAALRQYREVERILHEELAVPPEPETVELFEAIRTRRTPPPPALGVPKPAAASALPVSPPAPPALRPSLPHNLPHYATPFVGREPELSDILHRLTDPNCRLLVLIGPGGIGKTRLAAQAGQRLADQPPATGEFADGIVFVSLASADSADSMICQITDAVAQTVSPDAPGAQQLFDGLRAQRMLLVLDSSGHLPAGGENVLSDLLAAAPGVKVLLTTRAAVSLQEAWFYPVAGLSFPGDSTPGDVHDARYDAVRLFEQQALRVRADFSLAAETRHVVRICRLVGGMPLAIELAAAWLRALTPAQIADEIARSMDILTAQQLNVSARHRSMRVVIEQTWALLSKTERQSFRRLAVFRGGFSREAAADVAGISLLTLATLVDHSLLRLQADGRYQMHELLRQYAGDHLHAAPTEEAALRDRHAAFYLDLLCQQAADLKGARAKAALDAIAGEQDNVWAAWAHAVTRRDTGALAQAAGALWLFSDCRRGALAEGEAAFEDAVAALAGDAAHDDLTGFLMAGQGWLAVRQGEAERGRALLEQGLARQRRTLQRDAYREAFSLLHLGLALQQQGKHEAATEMAEQAWETFSELGDRWGIAVCFALLGASALGRGQLAEADRLLRACLAVCRETGDPRTRLVANTRLADVALWWGDYGQAAQRLEEASASSHELGDLFGSAQTLHGLGRLAVAQGDYGRAVESLQRSLALLEDNGIRDVAAVLNDLGFARYLQGDYDAAEQAFRRGLQRARELGQRGPVAAILSQWACLAQAQGDESRAAQRQDEALALYETLGHEPGAAAVLRDRGHWAAASAARRDEARRHYRQALWLAVAHRLAPLALDVLTGVAHLLAATGDEKDAAELLALVAGHTACAHATRERARQGLETLAARLSVGALAAAQAQGPLLAWLPTAQQLAEALDSPLWADDE